MRIEAELPVRPTKGEDEVLVSVGVKGSGGDDVLEANLHMEDLLE